jgi:hypothetical protein
MNNNDVIEFVESVDQLNSCCRESLLLDALYQLVLQECLMDDGRINSFGITARAEAIYVLEAFGKVEIESYCGRSVVARPKEPLA